MKVKGDNLRITGRQPHFTRTGKKLSRHRMFPPVFSELIRKSDPPFVIVIRYDFTGNF
ncbi:MAG TPA: hypothetical protein VFG29_02930 [Syntrophales bacterium]|nr:hypothetical protein [Syntrophales bacterium]